MNTRTIIRRARAVAALYLTATIDADIAYRGHRVDSKEHRTTLDILSRRQDALYAIINEIGCWNAYPTLREGKTLGAMIREGGEGAKDGHAEWLARVGADVDARIADPKGTRKMPLPKPFDLPFPAVITIGRVR